MQKSAALLQVECKDMAPPGPLVVQSLAVKTDEPQD